MSDVFVDSCNMALFLDRYLMSLSRHIVTFGNSLLQIFRNRELKYAYQNKHVQSTVAIIYNLWFYIINMPTVGQCKQKGNLSYRVTYFHLLEKCGNCSD